MNLLFNWTNSVFISVHSWWVMYFVFITDWSWHCLDLLSRVPLGHHTAPGHLPWVVTLYTPSGKMVAIRLVCASHTSVWKIILNWDIQRKISISDLSWKKWDDLRKWALRSSFCDGMVGEDVVSSEPWFQAVVCSGAGKGTICPWRHVLTCVQYLRMIRYQMRVRERIVLSVCIILLWETVNSKARDLVLFILINPQCFTDVNWIERKLFWAEDLKVACKMLKEDAECLKS